MPANSSQAQTVHCLEKFQKSQELHLSYIFSKHAKAHSLGHETKTDQVWLVWLPGESPFSLRRAAWLKFSKVTSELH